MGVCVGMGRSGDEGGGVNVGMGRSGDEGGGINVGMGRSGDEAGGINVGMGGWCSVVAVVSSVSLGTVCAETRLKALTRIILPIKAENLDTFICGTKDH